MTTYTVENDQQEALQLGRQGEYNVTEFVFDLSELQEEVGDGTAVMVHYPYSGEPYIIPSTAGETYDAAVQDGTTVTWTIGQLATMYKGDGVAVVSWITESGLKKSRRYKTNCLKAVTDSAEEITDVQQAYIDQMAALSAEMTAELQAAQDLKDEIETAAETAKSEISAAASEAETDLEDAVTAANNKITEIEDAGEAAVAAAQAAANVTVTNECLIYGGANNG